MRVVSARRVVSVVVPLLAVIPGCTSHQPPPAAVEVEEPGPAVRPSFPPVPEPLQLDRGAEARASVTGIVRDENGQPLAGAQVCAWNLDRHAEAGAPRCAGTDPAGVYELTGLVPSLHEIHASAAEHQPVGLSGPLGLGPGERRAGVEFQLVTGGAPMHGMVRDTRGQPVAGAWVSNFDPEGTRRGRGGAAATRTEADGRFMLWLSEGPQDLIAGADGFASTRRADAVAPGRYTLEIERGATLAGQVLDLNGTPLVGARVVALAHGVQESGGAHTDADGHFTIVGLRPGLYKPRAEAPGRSGEGSRSVFIGPGASSSPQVFALRPAASMSGRMIVVGGQQSCASGQVMLHSGGGGRSYTEIAGPDGAVYFPAVQPGTYYVQAECPKAAAPTEVSPVEVGLAPVRELTWQFVAGRSIRGAVVDAEGRPLAGGAVRVDPVELACGEHCSLPKPAAGGMRCMGDSNCAMDEICDGGVCVFAGAGAPMGGAWWKADAAGRFVVAGLPSGRYTVTAQEAEGIAAAPLEVTVGESDVDGVRVVATRRGQVRGVVVDERGEPWIGAIVELLADRGMNIVYAVSGRTDDEGRFALFDVKPGDYVVRAHASAISGAMWGTERLARDVRVRVEAGGPAEVRLTLAAQRGQIGGRVVGSDGAPVPDAYIVARRELPEDVPEHMHEALRYGAAEHAGRTDARGAFTLRGLAAGTYTLWAHRGVGIGEVFRGRVKVGSKVTLALPATFTLEGRLANAATGELALRIHAAHPAVGRVETFVDAGGRWAFEGLPAGTYEVYADQGEMHGWAVVTVSDGPLEEVVVPITKAGAVRGTVVDAGSRTPLGGVAVRFAPAGKSFQSASWPMETITDESGHFEVGDLPAGPLTVTFPAYEPRELEVTVEPEQMAEVTAMLRLDPNRSKR